jgi:hypothetical protein
MQRATNHHREASTIIIWPLHQKIKEEMTMSKSSAIMKFGEMLTHAANFYAAGAAVLCVGLP